MCCLTCLRVWHVAFILGCMIMFRNTFCKEGGVDIYSDLCGEGEKGGERCQSEGRVHPFSSSLSFPDSTFLEIGKMSVSLTSALHPS